MRSSAGRQLRGHTMDAVAQFVSQQIGLAIKLSLPAYAVLAAVDWYTGATSEDYYWRGFISDQVTAISFALGIFGAVIGLAGLRAILISRS
ncbi:hypothetical protein ACQPZK_20490 [Micromonospora sp. CA-249363]|uniref:hypothetical protein n=1 Tax=Micromonospora sp. CA-249363 TaxID=3239963 RepID=UPI003D9430A3